MPVDDHAEVVPDDDQVHPGVRPGASAVVGQRRAGGLANGDVTRAGPGRATRSGRKPDSE